MKKVFFGLSFVIAVCLFLAIPTHTSALTRTNGPGCNSDETNNYFPYGFMCGTDPNYNLPVKLKVTSGGTTISGSDASPTPIAGGSTISVAGGWSDTARPKNNQKSTNTSTLTWITVNAKNASSQTQLNALHLSGLSGSGIGSVACPGTNSVNTNPGTGLLYTNPSDSHYSGPGPLFGFRDINGAEYDSSTTNLNNASPVAYNKDTGRGIVNCGNHGKMVFWNDSGSSSPPGTEGYKFDINTDNVNLTDICIRLDVSIDFTTDDGGFSLFPPATSNYYPHEENVAASHLVKQSDERCFSIVKQPTANSWDVDMTTTCSVLSGHIIKYDGSANATNSSNGYILQHWNQGAGAWENVPGGGGSTNGGDNSFAVGINGDAYYGNGRDNAFQVVNGANGSYGTLPVAGSGGVILGGNQNCHDDTPMINGSWATCTTVHIGGVGDNDPDSTGHMQVEAVVYNRKADGSRGSKVGDYFNTVVQGSSGGDGHDIAIKPIPTPDDGNNGIIVDLGVENVNIDKHWDDTWYPGDGPISIASCYTATCTITAQSPGLPPNYVEMGKAFSITATITNTGGGDSAPLYTDLGGSQLAITPDGTSGTPNNNGDVGFTSPLRFGKQVDLGSSQSTTFNGFTADNSFGTFSLGAYTDYNDGGGGNGFLVRQSQNNPNPLPCRAASIKRVQHFHITPVATLNPDPADGEDPTTVTYSTKLVLKNTTDKYATSKPVKSNATSEFYKLPVGSGSPGMTGNLAARQYVNGSMVGTTGPYNDGDNITINTKTYNVPPGFQAGDKYCSEVETVAFNDGWIGDGGPDDIVRGTAPDGTVTPSNVPEGPSDTHCVTINNKSLFKVYNSSVSAGGDFADASNQACDGGGQLGGWFDNTHSEYGFGSSAQLSALALLKITGVASAQTAATRSPTDLTFANSVATDKTPVGGYSAGLGGDFGLNSTAASHCLTYVKPDAGAVTLPSGDLSTLPTARKSYTYDHNLTLTNGAGALKVGADTDHTSNVSIFVKGDVYISSNITYNTAGWVMNNNTKTIPSFVLHTNGNIYIAPGVTQLDGLYVAEPKADASGNIITPKTRGAIYTCGTAAYAPVTGTTTHTTCKNQLTVHGSFVAEHVNLMRTYGTMRNEKPHPPSGAPTSSPAGFKFFYGTIGSYTKLKEGSKCASDSTLLSDCLTSTTDCPSGSNLIGDCVTSKVDGTKYNCVLMNDPGDPLWRYNSPAAPYDDNYACLPASSSAHLAWTWASNSPNDQNNASEPNGASLTALKALGYKYCMGPFTPSDSPGNTVWWDNYLCSDKNLDMTLSLTGPLDPSSHYCTQIGEPGDPNYAGYWAGKVFVCESVSTTVTPPDFPLGCDNAGVTSFTRLQASLANLPGFNLPPGLGAGPATCAAEVFDFSPEMYLSDQSLAPPNGGAHPFDAITSLPPVL